MLTDFKQAGSHAVRHALPLCALPRLQSRDAAAELGISERTLYRKIKEYDIEE